MGYEIYDRESGNLVDGFPTEREALEMVRRVIEEDGAEAVDGWLLGSVEQPGKALSGQDLLVRAEEEVPA
jgi:hypothetical protein